MIKEVLSILDVKKLHSDKYHYSFECNLDTYMVYRSNQYHIFSFSKFKHVDPLDLVNDYFINEASFREEVAKRKSESEIFDSLKDTTFKKALGQFLQIRHLENTRLIENIPQSDLEYFSKLEFIRDRFFVTKYGLSIFSNQSEGIIYFNKLNSKHIGCSKLELPRINHENIDIDNEHQLILFSPYTIKDAFQSGHSHFKDSIVIINDTDKLNKDDLYAAFTIHLRPTYHELLSTINYLSFYLNHNKISTYTYLNSQNQLNFRTYCGNYAKTRNAWINKLSSQKSILTGKDISEDFSIRLLKKNVNGTDLVEFYFDATADNMVVFIQYFLFTFYNSTKVDVKRITKIHYEKDFPIILEETISTDDIEFVDNHNTVSDENDFDEINNY